MKTENNIHSYPEIASFSEAAARLIIGIVNDAILQQGKCTIALSGGHTPQSVYKLLATLPFSNEISWEKTFFFWSDERCVPSNDPRNNSFQAKKILLNKINIPAENIFSINTEIEPMNAASDYEETIRKFFGEWKPLFDLILLGIGENGHTASLFPRDKIAINEIKLVVDVYVPEQNMHRITMTPYLINNAVNILFLASGIGKAEILKQTLCGAENPEKIPAQAIHPKDGTLYWIMDTAAASLLPKHTFYEH